MIDRVVYNMELSTFDFIDMIQEPSYWWFSILSKGKDLDFAYVFHLSG
jgi:hypothetical protein